MRIGASIDVVVAAADRRTFVLRIQMTRFFPHSHRHTLVLAALALGALPAVAQTVSDRLVIHGYLTQGYATTNAEPIMGIPDKGTFDYRRAAVLLRFKGTPNDAFVVQLANRRLGESPINAFTPEVQLDWAFYERRLGSNTTLRIGKEPIPTGIFNETRYLGTLLPFYRAPIGFYGEGTYTNETLNGVVLTRKLNPHSAWQVTGSLFGGAFDYLQSAATIPTDSAPSRYYVTAATADNLIGATFWLQTPLTGLRIGAGASRRNDHGSVTGDIVTKDAWTSVDGAFDRFTTRAEFRYLSLGGNQQAYWTYYGQLGYHITDALELNVQRDVTHLDLLLPNMLLRIPFNQDNAGGIAYTFAPNIVGKLEYHDSDGYSVEAPVNFFGDAIQSRYIISSISVTF